MASNNTLPSSSARKHGNSAFAAVLLRRWGTHNHKKHYYSGNSSPVNFRQGFPKAEVSARKLAAGLWQLWFTEVSGEGGGGAALGDGSFCSSMSESEVNFAPQSMFIVSYWYHPRPCSLLQPANGNIKITFPHHHNSGEKIKETKDLLRIRRPVTILRSRNELRCELESSQSCLKFSKEEATKWDLDLAEASNEFTKTHSRKLHEDRKLVGNSVVTALLQELLWAQRSINKLKAAQKSSKKKVEQFLQNLEEEKVCWNCRERQKIQAMLDDLKDQLARERRSRERMELLNAKLVHELAEANLSAKQFLTNYEKEKKERELIEEVCNQLAMQIGEDKAKLEGLLRDSMKFCEEVEEERKMMQRAELWREERAQMKLVDAKLVLEDKYNQMVQLIAYLQMFLRSRGAELSTIELEGAQLIKQAAELVNIQRIVELSYDFSKSDDIFPIYEELRKDNASERVNKPYSHPTLTGPLSTIHIVSLDEEGLTKKFALHQRRVTYLVNVNQDNIILGSEAECSEKAGLESLKTGVNGVCTLSAGQSKWKASPASKLLKSSPSGGTPSSSEKTSQHKRSGDSWFKHKDSVAKQNSADLTFDECNRRLSTDPIHSGGTTSTSPCKGSVEGSFRHSELLGQGNSTMDTMNPHITRGMKGCLEWPRRIPKTNSKVIPLGERVRRQKSQLQHILQPKAFDLV